MPATPDHHEAHDYAERIRERLPRRLQELREATGLSMYALWLKCGVSRDTISRIEGGETIPGVHVLARLAWGVEKTITGTSNNTNGVSTLGQSADFNYNQSQMQDVLNKLDEFINAARR